jgi:hypothetical protein
VGGAAEECASQSAHDAQALNPLLPCHTSDPKPQKCAEVQRTSLRREAALGRAAASTHLVGHGFPHTHPLPHEKCSWHKFPRLRPHAPRSPLHTADACCRPHNLKYHRGGPYFLINHLLQLDVQNVFQECIQPPQIAKATSFNVINFSRKCSVNRRYIPRVLSVYFDRIKLGCPSSVNPQRQHCGGCERDTGTRMA